MYVYVCILEMRKCATQFLLRNHLFESYLVTLFPPAWAWWGWAAAWGPRIPGQGPGTGQSASALRPQISSGVVTLSSPASPTLCGAAYVNGATATTLNGFNIPRINFLVIECDFFLIIVAWQTPTTYQSNFYNYHGPTCQNLVTRLLFNLLNILHFLYIFCTSLTFSQICHD